MTATFNIIDPIIIDPIIILVITKNLVITIVIIIIKYTY